MLALNDSLAVICNPVGYIEHELPESVLKVAYGRAESLVKIYWSTFVLQIIEYFHKLCMSFVLSLLLCLFDEQVCLIVTVERPMILIEASKSHPASIIDFNGLHVKILKRLFNHSCTIIS